MHPRLLLPMAVLLAGAGTLPAQTDAALQGAAADYRARVVRATDELNLTRERVAAEKVPLLERMRALQDRVIAAESEATRLETQREDATEARRKLLFDLDAVRKTGTYVGTLAHDGLKAATGGLAPGEDQFLGNRLQDLQAQLEHAASGMRVKGAADTVEFLLLRLERSVGGYRADGRAMVGDGSEVLPGTFVFAGPETFFRPATGGGAGMVRLREGAKYPVSYPLAMWRAEDADRFFSGQPGMLIADATGGKALKLRETTGTVWEHVRKGGVVALAIVSVGLLALLLIFLKVRDLARMKIDDAATVDKLLQLVARGARAEAERAAAGLRLTTRELFVTGLRHLDEPANLLEERLQAVLLEQRLRYERRLPLLSVIATAAPLMGLLGTVVGMVKTFALITVFGTGNAGRLSSGISEVLVATELGLAVAIPTLVAHGFLAHRIQRNLSQLERCALQFTTAAGAARAVAGGEPQTEPLNA